MTVRVGIAARRTADGSLAVGRRRARASSNPFPCVLSLSCHAVTAIGGAPTVAR